MSEVQVMPTPVSVLPSGEVDALLRRIGAARGLGTPRQVGGLALEITGGGGPDRLVWGTFGTQDGLLALYSGERLVSTADKGLGEIIRVQPLALPGLPHFAVMVDDRVDQMLGAFEREERRRIYVWDGRGLRQVYQGTLSAEQYRHARWDNPRGPNAWRLRRTTGEIAVQAGRLSETTKSEELEAPGAPDAPVPPARNFRLISSQKQERHFNWNARLRRFEPA